MIEIKLSKPFLKVVFEGFKKNMQTKKHAKFLRYLK